LAGCGSNIPGESWLSYGFKERQQNRQKRKERSFARGRKRGRQGEVNRDLGMESTSKGSDDREIDHGIRGYVGWVYHVGTNSLGCQFCHARYLVIKGKHITMFKRNPMDYPQAVSLDHLHHQAMMCGLDCSTNHSQNATAKQSQEYYF
jgi:hypothetical protein